MAGHVFIARGDITQLACDAWFMPCGEKPRNRRFLPAHLRDFDAWPSWPESFSPVPPAGPVYGTQRVVEIPAWPDGEPRPWLVNVGGIPGTPPEWYAEGVRQALEIVAPAVLRRKPLFGRSRHLVATPVVGVGGGRLEDIGRAVQDVLALLYAAAGKDNVDFVLVTLGDEQYAAAQFHRGRFADPWPSLTPLQREHAERLARLAAEGRLALFLGAGVSQNAGLPGWGALLRGIAEAAGVESGDLDELSNPLDQASYLARRLGRAPGAIAGQSLAADGATRLRSQVCDIIAKGRHHFSLMHSLLAALPVSQAVTTNYDQLFEWAWDASAAQNPEQLHTALPTASSAAAANPNAEPLAVLTSVIPHLIRPNAHRWLLKMHGCVSHPESIVLTRENYIQYDFHWAALEGILQATLVTQHMVFIGFSLTDDNFLRILDGVRRIVRPAHEGAETMGPFGTALTTAPPSARQHLFEGDLEWVTMSAAAEADEPLNTPHAARQLQIFLDCLGSQLRTPAYLLNDRYDSLLTEEERQLRDGLRRLAPLVRALSDHDSAAARAVGKLFRELGEM